jgi:hypothetical protein
MSLEPNDKAVFDTVTEVLKGQANWYDCSHSYYMYSFFFISLTLRACFTYVPGSTTRLRLADKGDGGWEELEGEINEGKVQFFYVAFDLGNMIKYCYIGYCGASSPSNTRGQFSNHYNQFSDFLKVCFGSGSCGESGLWLACAEAFSLTSVFHVFLLDLL